MTSTAGRTHPDGSERRSAAVTEAVRAAGRFDRAMISPAAGLLAAIPVVTVLAIGIAIGKPVWGVTMGAGAMLVGTAWRVTGGRPPLALMATDATVMAISTYVGCVTGSVAWVHIAIICVWSMMGGLLVGLGNRGGAIGTQAIIAVVVFGRFNEPAWPALGLATLVLVGGLAQVIILSIVRWPLPLRAQRHTTAEAFWALSELAAAGDDASTLPAGDALDAAEATLSAPTMFGDAALMTLRSLVSEGLRLRVQLMALHTLMRQQRVAGAEDEPTHARAVRTLALTAPALQDVAAAIEGDAAAASRLDQRIADVNTSVQADADQSDAALDRRSSRRAAVHTSRRLAALAGQLRAVAALARAAGKDGEWRARRPLGRTTRPWLRLREDLAQLRANASLDSPAGRHAVRLGVVVPVAEIIARELPLQRSYWVAVAAATVLRPEFGATFTRGTERALGTCLGVGLAGAITVALHPAGGVSVVMVGILAWLGFAVFPASFALGFGFITALVVFLINVVVPDTFTIASARLVDTLVGGALGLVAYVLWPTWSRTPALQALADLLGTERAYVDRVLAEVSEGTQPNPHEMRTLARRARKARTTAESTVARSLSEPSTRRIDADQSRGALGQMRRLIQAAHVLRLDVEDERDRRPLTDVAPLRAGMDRLLSMVESTLRARAHEPAGPPPGRPPDLRADFHAFARATADDREAVALRDELDEMVDAANSLAVVAGLPIDTDEDTPDV
ncbi:MAG TPA: FUSC family protein [Solirubrobacteraceae bacterium]|jgi:uncharacterized membrane protein YccC|nr:FUSC family protein [Solirubrobacteraceae bacterium]